MKTLRGSLFLHLYFVKEIKLIEVIVKSSKCKWDCRLCSLINILPALSIASEETYNGLSKYEGAELASDKYLNDSKWSHSSFSTIVSQGLLQVIVSSQFLINSQLFNEDHLMRFAWGFAWSYFQLGILQSNKALRFLHSLKMLRTINAFHIHFKRVNWYPTGFHKLIIQRSRNPAWIQIKTV